METVDEVPDPSRLEFLERLLANNVVLSDAEDNTSGPLNRVITTVLPSSRTLLSKILEPSFWKVMEPFFISIGKFWQLLKLLEQLLAHMNFMLDSEEL